MESAARPQTVFFSTAVCEEAMLQCSVNWRHSINGQAACQMYMALMHTKKKKKRRKWDDPEEQHSRWGKGKGGSWKEWEEWEEWEEEVEWHVFSDRFSMLEMAGKGKGKGEGKNEGLHFISSARHWWL